jgi:hypothetical protein
MLRISFDISKENLDYIENFSVLTKKSFGDFLIECIELHKQQSKSEDIKPVKGKKDAARKTLENSSDR